jgi:hypothetical protein
MPLTPEELYLRLGALVDEMPDLRGPLTPEAHKWLGRACTLVAQVDPSKAAYTTTIQVACQMLTTLGTRETNAQTITVIVHQALAEAELDAPARVQGMFIAAGHTLDAYAAVGQALSTANASVLLVDPFADVKIVTHYAVLAAENIAVRVLTDAVAHKSTLKPAAENWQKQFKQTRPPLEVRLALAGSLHDRLIVVDDVTAYTLGQSFNRLAERAHTSIVRVDEPETRKLKIDAYLTMWQSATPLL